MILFADESLESLLVCRSCRVTREQGWDFTGLTISNGIRMADLCEMCARPTPMLYELTTDRRSFMPEPVRWAEPVIAACNGGTLADAIGSNHYRRDHHNGND